MADSPRDFHTTHRVRNLVRLLLVLAVVGLVVGFTVGKYVSDDDLKDSTTTKREENVSELSGARIEVAQCPCQNETFPWSTFVSFQAPLSLNNTLQVELCQQAIVPELRTASPPTLNSSLEDTQAYITYLDTLSANFAVQLSCSLAVQQLLTALNPDPDTHLIGFGDNFYSTELLSESQLRQRLDAFIGQLTYTRSSDFGTQLALQQILLGRVVSNLTNIVASIRDGNTTDAATTADTFEASSLSFDLYRNATADALSTLLDTASNTDFNNRLLNTLKGAVSVDYTSYMDACMPYYCDYTVRKSAWSRLTEFLGLLGGLYTTFISLGLIIWFILEPFLPV